MNAVQKWAREHTRLGIPVLFHEESLHGLAAKRRDQFSAGNRPRLDLGSRPGAPGQLPDRGRDARARRLPGTLPGGGRRARSALGPDRGDHGRGPLPRGRTRRRRCRRPAGRGDRAQIAAGQGLRHAQAHDRARPARIRHQRRPGADLRARPCARCSSRPSSRW